MYRFSKQVIEGSNGLHYRLYRKDQQLRYAGFLTSLKEQKAFRSFFIELLQEIPFHTYQWETPPVSSNTKEQPFEFVVTNNPGIDLPPDPGPFRQYFGEDPIAVFDNLGGDAKLVAPQPHSQTQDYNYSHIGVFSRQAPPDQQQALWKRVGEAVEARLSERPLWLNTAGGGVAWLHVRLDSRPKYYRYKPYRNTTGQ